MDKCSEMLDAAVANESIKRIVSKASSWEDTESEGESVDSAAKVVSSGDVGVREADIASEDQTVADKMIARLPKKGATIQFRPNGSEMWKTVHVISRAGKASGKYKYFMNVRDNEEGKVSELDFENDVKEWREITNEDHQKMDEVLYSSLEKEREKELVAVAKKNELDNWKRECVYEEIDFRDQQCISVRWVITNKVIDNQQVTKARLVARGFEETRQFRTDSPTCQRENLRVVLAVISSKKWQCQSIDIKAAFLQRQVY